MSGIFISYRRDDSRDIAGRLVDRLRQDYSDEQLFLDIDAIPAGRTSKPCSPTVSRPVMCCWR